MSGAHENASRLTALFAAAGVKIGGPNQNPWGWFSDLPANEGLNARHQVGVTPVDLPREGWTREYDNPNVEALRGYLSENNGIKGLEVCEPWEVEKAARIFHRDGFVAVKDCLNPEQLARMRMTTDRAIMQAIESGPPGAPSFRLSLPPKTTQPFSARACLRPASWAALSSNRRRFCVAVLLRS